VARYSGSVCRICRREGMKLFLKGERCYTDKCAFERRGYPPGQHGQTRGKMSEYALQLREKQKVRRLYGLGETQFKNLFAKAERKKGITGETLMSLLERRLDNVLYKSGFSTSRRGARMMISHGLFTVNGRKVTIPSYSVSVNEAIDVAGKEEDRAKISENLKLTEGRPSPQWMAIDRNALKATVLRLPVRADITMPPIEERLIVGLYSK